jgi:hypothetical protein
MPRPGWVGGGLPSPDRRLLAVEFGDPAWYDGPGQVMDVWLLDLRPRRWRQLPGIPVLAFLKLTSMAWTGWRCAACASRPTAPGRTRSSPGDVQPRRDSDRAISGTRDRQ